MLEHLRGTGPLDDWNAFAASWNSLAPDTYLADHGRYRRRRHAVFTASNSGAGRASAVVRDEHQPHYQSREYNPLQGGIERWFEPIEPAIDSGASLLAILRFAHRLFGCMVPDVRSWRVEVHQFRIEARPGEPGQPTPEGVHRDGVDFVLVLMIKRTNIAQGTTTIHARDGKLLGSFTLADPFDAALVDDARVFHGVTAVEAIDAAQPAYRDVLVVTFKRTTDE
ncbi:MAG TPA: 2OG-Fe dioxygenase family protein [Rudaea sp.]|nr:2OG-Fe dioxygenase family protein [Rudaea sp.]